MKVTRARKGNADGGLHQVVAAIGMLEHKVTEGLKKIWERLTYSEYIQQTAIEMNFWVSMRAMLEKVGEDGDAEKALDRIHDLQEEYLATMAVAEFLAEMGKGQTR